MTANAGSPPSDEIARAVLAHVSPGSTLREVAPLPGSYSNYSHLIRGATAAGDDLCVVVRRYRIWHHTAAAHTNATARARREYTTLGLLRRHGIPAPQPLLLDETGERLGSPGIVTRYVPGAQVEEPSDPVRWAESLAVLLARLHSIPIDAEIRGVLLDVNDEATWFLRGGRVPPYMEADPDGAAVWHAVRGHFGRRQSVRPTLVHTDYWPGNILWVGDTISAVLDLEEAGTGDPAIDVAYCRMDIAIRGYEEAEATFLARYEAETGAVVANLALWELAAAARPMHDPAGWIDCSPARERFRRFVADALRRLRPNPGGPASETPVPRRA